MADQSERRRHPRKDLDPPGVACLFIHSNGTDTVATDKPPYSIVYVDCLNKSDGGVLLKSKHRLEPDTQLYLQIYDFSEKKWDYYQGLIRRTDQDAENISYSVVGVESQNVDPASMPQLSQFEDQDIKPLPSDYEFFITNKLLGRIPREAVSAMLNQLKLKQIKAGARFIRQGDPGDTFYLIQNGTCVASVEKEGKLHSVGRIREGDFVGEMSVLLGEPRSAHVDAETDMDMWGMTKQQFDQLAREHPELCNFLTELLADRLSSRELTADRTIGKYLITDIIGSGGYSIVYKGIHKHLNRPVAIKMMKHDLAMEPDFLIRFRNEAKIIAQFNHPNIVNVYDIEERFRTVFIIMEHLEGMSLEYILENMSQLPLPRILNILVQVCAGLQYAHKQGIVHQDIKPANIFILPDDQVKILDFGLAAPVGTEDFELPGSLRYMAPEQLEGEAVNECTDIFSLGISAYEMVTGKKPYPQKDPRELLRIRLNQDIPDPMEDATEIPPSFRQFILKACARDPDQRYQQVHEILQDLMPLTEDISLPEYLEKRKMINLFLVYNQNQELVLNRLVEDFSAKVKKLGIILKGAEFKDL